MSRRATAATWPLVATALLVLTVAPASAQDDQPGSQQPDVRLVVTGLSSVLGPGTLPADATPDRLEAAERVTVRALVENTGETDIDELRLSVEVYEAVPFRSTLRTALDLEGPGALLTKLTTAFLPIRDGGRLAAGDIAGVTFASTAQELELDESGNPGVVFPVRLTVLDGSDALDQVTTSVIYLTTPVSVPMATVLGWPVDDQPWRRARGVYTAGVDAPLAPGGRLDTLLRAVESNPDVPVTLLPGAHVLEDLIDRADGFARIDDSGTTVDVSPDDPEAVRSARFLARLQAVLGSSSLDPLASAYADTDVSALAHAAEPLDDEAASAVSRGRLRLAQTAARVPQPATYWASTPLDRATLELVTAQTATERVVLPFSHLDYRGDLDAYPPDVPGPLSQVTTPSGRQLVALVPDPYVDRALREADQSHGPLVAVQRTLAETAVLWTERPLTRRPLIVMPPLDWDPSGRFASMLLGSLATAPWIELGGVEALDALAVGRDDPLPLPETAGSLSQTFLDALLAARQELAAVQGALPADEPLVAGRTVDELELQLLRAPSAWFVAGGLGAALVNDVRTAVDQAYGEIDVAEGAQITLTSDTGQIPITIQRPAGGPLDVLISIDETRANLAWPQGQVKQVTLPGTGAQTYSFAVQARSTGRFSVNVRVTDPTGLRELATGTIDIRSTAISGPALFGTAGVIALLLVVGALRRRSDRPRLEVVG